MSTQSTLKIALLNDYQRVALEMADWSDLQRRAEITVFHEPMPDPNTVVERLKPFNVLGLIRERTPLPRSVLERLPNLKLIASTSMRNAAVDMAAAKEFGIVVCGTGSPSHGAPLLTWALILAIVRKLPEELASVRNGGWQTAVGGDLYGKTLGVVGLGKLGAIVAKMGQVFGMNVIAWSQNLTRETAEQHGAKLVSKEELFRQADVVTVHLVLSDRSRDTIGATEVSWMKPSAYLVNTSRGPLINEKALIVALENRTIAGAALDVYDTEPLPPTHPFRSLDNVLATPHSGFVTEETYKIFYGDTVENITAWLNGKPIRVLNP